MHALNETRKSKSIIFGAVDERLRELKNLSILQFQDSATEFENETFSGQLVDSAMEDMIKDLYVTYLIESKINYRSHFHNCISMLGRIMTEEEGKFFEKELFEKYNSTKSFEERENKTASLSTWVVGGSLDAENLNIKCPLISGEEQLLSRNIPCILDIKHSFCLTLMYTQYYLYGEVSKFGRSYSLVADNDKTYLKGDSMSYIYQNGSNWILSSDMHDENVLLVNQSLPFGRKFWHYKGEKILLTLTHCNQNQFACSDGKCISSKLRCSGSVECGDSSDEENCAFIRRSHGYLKDTKPPPRYNEKQFTMRYDTKIYNIADISTSDGIAIVDIEIRIKWYDSRLQFWNVHGIHTINCDDIWYPDISIADSEISGFQLKFEKYRHTCLLAPKTSINTQIQTDPYMGKI